MKLEIQEAAKNKPMRGGLGFIAVYFDQLIKQQFRFCLKKNGRPEKGRCLFRHCTIHLFIAWQENGLDVWQNTTLASVHIKCCG
jgi:hypothetical protein